MSPACFKPMKYLLILLLLTSYGCRKCAECNVTTSIEITGQPTQTAYSTTELCGDDLKERDGNETVSTSTVNGNTATVRTWTRCE